MSAGCGMVRSLVFVLRAMESQQEVLSKHDGEREVQWGSVGGMIFTFRSSFWLLHSE